MERYGITISTDTSNGRYREGDDNEWDLTEAERIAFELLESSSRVRSITVGNGTHEFRMWNPNVTDFGQFSHPGGRWSTWYVDAEINGRRWRYRPLADLDGWEDADLLSEEVAELHPDVTKVWTGASDGSKEFEYPTVAS